MFKVADEEFQPLAKELFKKFDGMLSVDPDEILFLRSDKDSEKYAYAKIIHGEYQLLTNKKFFIVIISPAYDRLENNAKKRYVILHEMRHCFWDDEKEKYKIKDHDVKDFSDLLKDSAWDLDLVLDIKNAPKPLDPQIAF